MKSTLSKTMAILCGTIILSACDIGGDMNSSTTVPVAQQPPAINEGATTLSGADIDASFSGAGCVIQFAGSTNVTISGSANTVTFAQNQVTGTVSIKGSGNLIVFKPGATVEKLTVTGASNTIWIPVGSGIVIANADSTSRANNVITYTA